MARSAWVSVSVSASFPIAILSTGLHSAREFHRCSHDECDIDEKAENKGQPPIAPAARVRRLCTMDIIRRVSAIAHKSIQKKCNHSIDAAATSGATALRDFFVNCEHAVESKRTRGRPIGRRRRAESQGDDPRESLWLMGHLTASASGNFQVPSTISFRGRYIRMT